MKEDLEMLLQRFAVITGCLLRGRMVGKTGTRMLSTIGSHLRHNAVRQGALICAACAVCGFAVPASASAELLPGLWRNETRGGILYRNPAFHVGTAAFGAPLTATPVTGNLRGTFDPLACEPLQSSELPVMAGKIAIVRRGTCSFVVKVKHVQDAGAIGAIVINDVPGPPTGMGGTDPTIVIPAVMVSPEDAQSLDANLANVWNLGLTTDLTAPVLSAPTQLVVNATGPSGAVASYRGGLSITDDLDPAPVLVCDPVEGTTLAVGDTDVQCFAADAVGNLSASVTFTVHVRGAAEQISTLAADIRALNLKQGIANSLDSKLLNLLAALSDVRGGARASACNQLDAVVNEVNAQAGREITAAQAATLLTDLARIRAVLAC